MGRHKLPHDQKKQRHTFRLSKECKQRLQKEANDLGIPMSRLLEQKIMQGADINLQKIK
jgi:predicted DNA-binding protein